MLSMSKKKAVPNTNPAHPITENSCLKFTYSVKADNESLTIRTDSESELEELRARWKFQIAPKREPKPHMNVNDPCPQCEGFLTLQTGRNRKTQKEFDYLSCSNWPTCQFSSYLAKEPVQEAASA